MTPSLSLSDDQIDLWFIDDVNTYSEQDLTEYLSLLNTEEKARHQRFVFAKDKRHFLLSRALLRTTLSIYHPATPPPAWDFVFNKYGKPAIANSHSSFLHFNLSHTQGLIALAVRRNTPVGVDVEGWQRTNNLDGLAEQCFTDSERAYFSSPVGTERQQRFFHIWTLKEAVVKALGEGISFGLTSFEFTIAKSNISIHGLDNSHPQNWHLNLWHYGSEFIAALASPMAIGGAEVNIRTFLSRPLKFYSEVSLPESQPLSLSQKR